MNFLYKFISYFILWYKIIEATAGNKILFIFFKVLISSKFLQLHLFTCMCMCVCVGAWWSGNMCAMDLHKDLNI